MEEKSLHELMAERQKKLDAIEAAGVDAFAHKFVRTHMASDITTLFAKIEPDTKMEQEKVSVAGRIRSIRGHGKLMFCHIEDFSGRVQILLEAEALGKKFDFSGNLNSGDFIGVNGFVYKSKRGEVSVWAQDFTILTKSLRPLPSEWFGLKDKEAKYRQRYVDLVLSPETRETFRKRAAIIQAFREFFISKGYMEVETPILQPIYGGTNARPFESRLNALDMKVYMRISNELYLKRLLVGGYEKIFEFSQDFRNEGIDKTHNPEFLLLETMWTYADYLDNMDLTEELFEFVTKKVFGTTRIQYGSNTIDFKRPWVRLTMLEAIKKHVGLDFDMPPAKALELAKKLGLEVDKDMSWARIVTTVFEEKVEHHLVQPTIVYDFPSETAPLAKKSLKDPRFAERFEPYANGWEIGNSYSELNDPRVLRANWDAQEKALKKGDEEAQRMDTDFLRSLEYGMPPASGLGIGMDRVIILLTNSESIRDVIFFPFMRPEDTEEPLAPVRVHEEKKHHPKPAQKPMDKALHDFEKASKPAHHTHVEKPKLKRLSL